MDKRKKIDEEIGHIIENRNAFAHFPANMTKEGIDAFNNNGFIQFFKFKNYTKKGSKEIGYLRVPEFTEKMIENTLTRIHLYTVEIRGMLRTLKK